MQAGVGPQGLGTCPEPCPCPSGRMLRSGSFSLFSLFSNFKRVVFQIKLCGGENPALPAVSGPRLLMECLVPWSTHQPPGKVLGCSKLVPSLPIQSDRYRSHRQPPPRQTTLKHLSAGFLPFFSLQGENIFYIFLQIIVNLLQPPAKACRDPSQNQLHKNDTFSATFSGLSLEPFLFPLRALLIKLACHLLLLKNKVDLSPRLQCARLLLGFRKSSQNTQ